MSPAMWEKSKCRVSLYAVATNIGKVSYYIYMYSPLSIFRRCGHNTLGWLIVFVSNALMSPFAPSPDHLTLASHRRQIQKGRPVSRH